MLKGPVVKFAKSDFEKIISVVPIWVGWGEFEVKVPTKAANLL